MLGYYVLCPSACPPFPWDSMDMRWAAATSTSRAADLGTPGEEEGTEGEGEGEGEGGGGEER